MTEPDRTVGEVPPDGPEDESAPVASDGVDAEPDPTEGAEHEPEDASVEDLVDELEAVILQRDEYLAIAQSTQAELENYRKRVMKQQAEHLGQAAAGLVGKLLPVLDAFDYGVGHGDETLVPLRTQLLGVLEKEGLCRVDPADQPFDPNSHDAVAHEPGEGSEPTVAETLRAGYLWNGRLLRPAMVRVRG